MNHRALLCAACLCLAATPMLVHAGDKAATATTAEKAKAAAPASTKPAMDEKAMQEMMLKAATPGPQHERLKKLVGEWNLTVVTMMDPSQPPQQSKATSVVTSLMDGRYFQEQSAGDMMGMPFAGMGITGYDNVTGKYVSTWLDNMGTGIMLSEGTSDANGNVITWIGESSDPMSGKKMKYRLVTRFVDDNKHTFEMFGKGPDGKEAKMMEITYERKM